MKKYIASFFLFFNILSFTFATHFLSRAEVQSHVKSYRQYLVKLSWEVSVPWSVIKETAKVLGLSQTEIDAIPISFPFLYDEKYKTVFELLDTQETIDQINFLIQKFESQSKSLSLCQKRQLLHQLIHELILKELGLPSGTTTKELAKIVAKGSLSIRRLCEIQLSGFFVKYYLKVF